MNKNVNERPNENGFVGRMEFVRVEMTTLQAKIMPKEIAKTFSLRKPQICLLSSGSSYNGHDSGCHQAREREITAKIFCHCVAI